MIIEIIFWLVIGLGVPSLLAYVCTFRAKRIIRWQANGMRLNKERFKLSDEQVDRMPMFPTDRAYMNGSRSNFVNNAVEHPEQFGCAITYIQTFGIIIWIMLAITISVLVCGLANGAIVTTR